LRPVSFAYPFGSYNDAARKAVQGVFPLAFTGTCTQEMCDVTAGLSQYSGLNAEVYGISVDSPFAQAAWAKQSKITVPLLSDLNKTVAAAYGVIFPGLAGIGDTSARAAGVTSRVMFWAARRLARRLT